MDVRKEWLGTRDECCKRCTYEDYKLMKRDMQTVDRCQESKTVVSSVPLRSFQAVAWLQDDAYNAIL
jgi:hypothetical protein